MCGNLLPVVNCFAPKYGEMLLKSVANVPKCSKTIPGGKKMTQYSGFWLAIYVGLAASAVPASAAAQSQVEPPPKAQDQIEVDPGLLPGDEEVAPVDDISLGEIPVVQTVELTPDSARRSVDAYVLLKEKYKDAKLEDFESLQDFVDRDALGKAFEVDVKAAGFENVTIWNDTITTVSNAYANIMDDQSADIKLQIEEVQKDTELAQDMKDRIVASLNALIPSENNRKVVQELIDNPAYTEKLKSLETEEE